MVCSGRGSYSKSEASWKNSSAERMVFVSALAEGSEGFMRAMWYQLPSLI